MCNVFFVCELVLPRLGLKEERVERHGHAVVGMEVKGARAGRFRRIEQREAPQMWCDHCCGESLTALNQKVAAPDIDRRGRRMRS